MPAIPTVPMPSGAMPMIGFGTWRLKDEGCERAVAEAIACGYRHIDTATGYENHVNVGKGLKAGGVPREDLFLVTKVLPHRHRRDDLLADASEALRDLQTDYLDLYLLHWPSSDIPLDETLGAMRKLMDDGAIRNCGVSNFTTARVHQAVGLGIVPIACNQVEYHPHLNQRKLLAACRAEGVVLTAYSPLGQGRIAQDAALAAIGAKYGKTAAQVALRWLFQKGIPAIPKASSRERILENLATLEWALSPEDFAAVDGLDVWERYIGWEQSGDDDRALNG